MRWRRGQGGGQVEDMGGSGGSRGRMPIPGGKIGGGVGGLGIVGIIIVVLVAVLGGGGGGGFGVDPGAAEAFPEVPQATGPGIESQAPDPDDELKQFVAFVVADVQASWQRAFERAGRTYEPTRLRLFNGAVNTGCGRASSASGPFYCPADRFVYLDLSFFRELRDRYGAPGDFAQAYVIAHEFGHHVQNLLGTLPQVNQLQRERPGDANELSVRLELQADCYAGLWGRSAYDTQILEEGDLEEGLAAAAAVGDDRLQTQATGTYDRESFTHGSSEQRQRWFLVGFQDGRVDACNTFSPSEV
ncbi:MAG: neutral zinc metallopeptidase [Thermoleophilia bacterium]